MTTKNPTQSSVSSMTGFGTDESSQENTTISVQVKSVNGRFLETRFRLPREFSPLEAELKKLVAKKLLRGTVDIFVNRVQKESTEQAPININLPVARAWVKAAQDLGHHLNMDAHLQLETLLRLPDVVQPSQTSDVTAVEKDTVILSLNKALDLCVEERRREGQALAETLNRLLETLDKFLVETKSKKTLMESQLQEQLKEKLKKLSSEISIDPQRLAQEALFLLEKADIAEEIARAETHVVAFRDSLKDSKNQSLGKKLEFYTQELHREVNTMGAKTQNLDVTLGIIEAKTTVERLREQVQNIE
jgi:uncharacterized protein (TIGR00255 family)